MVLVLVQGGPVTPPAWVFGEAGGGDSDDDNAGAAPPPPVGSVLLAPYGGATAGLALADVLFGAASPSGRLPVSVAFLPTIEPHSEH